MGNSTVIMPRQSMPWLIRICVLFIILFVMLSLFGEFLAGHTYREISLLNRFKPPAFLGGDSEYFPNILSVLIVQFTINLPFTILLETALSFL